MPKPTNLYRWATAQTDPGAETTEPTEPEKNQGWINATKPRAGYMNWLQNGAHKWIEWLDAFESTVHTWTATQTMSSAAIQDLTSSGLFTLTNLIVTGSTDLGIVTADGVTGDFVRTLQAAIRHADQTRYLPAPLWSVENNADQTQESPGHLKGGGRFWESDTASGWGATCDLGLKVGDRLKSVAVRILDSSGTSVVMSVWKSEIMNDGALTQVGTTQTSAANATAQTLTVSGLTETVLDGFAYFVKCNAFINHRVYGGKVVHDRIA